MEFTEQELKWIEETKKNKYDFSKKGNLVSAMNERYAGYKWQHIIPVDKIDERVKFDFQNHKIGSIVFDKETQTYS